MDEWIPLSDPDLSPAEVEAVRQVLLSPRLSSGPNVEAFEAEFAAYVGRRFAVACASGPLALLMALRAQGIGGEREVIAPSYGFRQTAHAIASAGAVPVFADVDYWTGTLSAEKVEARVGPKTAAILGANSNGHPAPWDALRAIADRSQLLLIEDSCEAVGSALGGRRVGGFGDCAVFDFSQPSALCCGEGGMLVTDDSALAAAVRAQRSGRAAERPGEGGGACAPLGAEMSELGAALGRIQLQRIDRILEKRKQVEECYFEVIKSFEGIKDPYVAPDVTEAHWMVYLVHLGTRFTRSSRDAILEDMHAEGIDARAFSTPFHAQPHYRHLGYERKQLFVTEKLAERALALPFHAHLDAERIAFIVTTMKDASVNVGAGAAIYL